jgi:hypothetical protein
VPQWQWILNEVFVEILGEARCRWRSSDHEGQDFVTLHGKEDRQGGGFKNAKEHEEALLNPRRRDDQQMPVSPRCDECQACGGSLQSMQLYTTASIAGEISGRYPGSIIFEWRGLPSVW